MFISPRFHILPVSIKILLHYFHLLLCCILSIFLHSCIKGSVNLQAIIIQIDVCKVVNLFAETFYIFCYCSTEIWCNAGLLAVQYNKLWNLLRLLSSILNRREMLFPARTAAVTPSNSVKQFFGKILKNM